MNPIVIALAATVILLVWMGFFMMGSLPLLVLKHDTAMDSGFIRGLFNVYYLAVLCTASVAALAYAGARRPGFAVGMACVAALAFAQRRWMVLPHMDALSETIPAADASIRQFRKLHIAGMLVNVVQLGVVAWSLTLLSV